VEDLVVAVVAYEVPFQVLPSVQALVQEEVASSEVVVFEQALVLSIGLHLVVALEVPLNPFLVEDLVLDDVVAFLVLP